MLAALGGCNRSAGPSDARPSDARPSDAHPSDARLNAASDASELKLVVTVGRHGVRSPGKSMNAVAPKSPDAYASESWPAWAVKSKYVTAHGKRLVRLLGGYYRDYYVTSGRIGMTTPCPAPQQVHARVDDEQRDIETAKGFYAGLFPGCDVAMEIRPPKAVDSLFHPHPTLCALSPEEASASILDQLGGSVGNVQQELALPLATIQNVLQCCEPAACGSTTPDRCTLIDLPSGITKKGEIYGAFDVGHYAAEVFLLQFAQGMPLDEVGWGRASRASILEMLEVQLRYQAVTDRAEPFAAKGGSNLAAHILGSLEQVVKGAEVSGIPQSVDARLVSYFGHDTNIQNLGGLLGLSWHNPGLLPNQSPPGSAIVFEIRRRRDNGSHFVRAVYVSQTLDQMAQATPLTLDAPPTRSAVRIAGCPGTAPHYDCPYSDFRRLVRAAVDSECVEPALRGLL